MHDISCLSKKQLRTAATEVCEWTIPSFESNSNPIFKLQSSSARACVCVGDEWYTIENAVA